VGLTIAEFIPAVGGCIPLLCIIGPKSWTNRQYTPTFILRKAPEMELNFHGGI
jgi:hypothetical protein